KVEASLPAHHPFVQIDRQIREEFGGRNTMIIAIVPKEGTAWRPDVLQIVHDVTTEALQLPDVMAQNVVSLAAPSVRYVEDRGGATTTDYVMREVPQTDDDIKELRARVDAEPQLRGMLVTPDERAALVVVDFYPTADHDAVWERVSGLTAKHAGAP